MARRRLEEGEIQQALVGLPAWRRREGCLVRDFRCADFADAFACMGRIAETADRLDHHPDWCQSWNRVEVSLTTHSAGGLTPLDLDLARAIDRIVEEAGCVSS
jgi:4a-hydroxytetrahydrobiopterin dehydratase